MNDDDIFLNKIVNWFSRVSCHQDDVTLDHLFCGAAIADFLSTFDINFFDEKWHDEIVYSDRYDGTARLKAMESVVSKISEFYITVLSRHLEGHTNWRLAPKKIAIDHDKKELVKMCLVVIFAAGTSSNLMEQMQAVFTDDDMQKLVEKLAALNDAIPAVCADDRNVMIDLVAVSKKDKAAAEKLRLKVERELEDLREEHANLIEEHNQLKRDYEMAAEKADTYACIVEQNNSAKRKMESTLSQSLNWEKTIASLESEIRELKIAKKTLELDVKDKAARISRLTDENIEVVTNYRELQVEITRLRATASRMSEGKQESREEELLKMRVESYLAEIARLREQLTDMETLKAHSANLQLINDDFERQMTAMVERSHEILAEKNTIKRRLDELERALAMGPIPSDPAVHVPTVSLAEELVLDGNAGLAKSFGYDNRLDELEKENAALKAKLDNIERQQQKLLSFKEESEEQSKTSQEVLQAKITSYRVATDEAEDRAKLLAQERDDAKARYRDIEIELERLKGELAMTTRTLREKDQALRDYVELHIQTNEALGSTTIGDEAKLKLDFVEMKVRNDKLAKDLRDMTNHRDQLIQEQRLISTHWYQTMLERHGDSPVVSGRLTDQPPPSSSRQTPNSTPNNGNISPSSTSSGMGFMRSASRRFPKLFNRQT
uniref:HOOK_N domain-containing protein n=1 Tax=Panagrellus redivivus TaxID=6233 RepID=A0A7E4UVU9_PANRE